MPLSDCIVAAREIVAHGTELRVSCLRIFPERAGVATLGFRIGRPVKDGRRKLFRVLVKNQTLYQGRSDMALVVRTVLESAIKAVQADETESRLLKQTHALTPQVVDELVGSVMSGHLLSLPDARRIQLTGRIRFKRLLHVGKKKARVVQGVGDVVG